jgi:hypothetical protein
VHIYLLTLADLIIKEGKNKENAVYDTAQISNEGRPEKEHVGIQTIRDNFEIYKLDVLTTFLMTKQHFEEVITEAEIAQIRKYFDPDFSITSIFCITMVSPILISNTRWPGF